MGTCYSAVITLQKGPVIELNCYNITNGTCYTAVIALQTVPVLFLII